MCLALPLQIMPWCNSYPALLGWNQCLTHALSLNFVPSPSNCNKKWTWITFDNRLIPNSYFLVQSSNVLILAGPLFSNMNFHRLSKFHIILK
jgi:hypothetical protein